MIRKWHIQQTDCVASAPFDEIPLLHPIAVSILSARGITTADDARYFLSPILAGMLSPDLMHGIAPAVERLVRARAAGEPVCIYGDYDVDGISGTALLVSFLQAAGFATVSYFIPNRFDEGYGLNSDSLERIAASGSTLVVSVDCGITAVDEAAYCLERGIDLIIVDHHAPKDKIPNACAVINPLQPGCAYPFKSLAGVGVAFVLMVALRTALRKEGAFSRGKEPDLKEWLDLVALGTIADVVPLTGQNRMYVVHGLKQLSSGKRVGIESLKRVSRIIGDVSCGNVGFRIAPRLNAAGRMESAVAGVELLLTVETGRADIIADELDAANSERQNIERRIFDEAVQMLDSSGRYPECRSIILWSREWHQGVVGIVSSRLVERYHRPVILIAIDSDGVGKGSGRSIPGFHLLDALKPCSSLLERFGGHRYAAGVGCREERLDDFSVKFEAEARQQLSDNDLIPQLIIDAVAAPDEVTPELALDLKKLEPFGSGNPEPTIMMAGMKVIDRKIVGDSHLRLRLLSEGKTFTAIAFRLADRVVPEKIDVAFFPEMNEWNGRASLQLKIRDFRPAE